MNKVFKNKKGIEMINLIIALVVGLVLLIILLSFTSTSSGSFWNKISTYFSPANVDTMKEGCNYACSTQAQYDYCELNRDITYLDDNGKKQKLPGQTCVSLARDFSKWGFVACQEISCVVKTCGDLTGIWMTSDDCKTKKGTDITSKVNDANELTTINAGAEPRRICCKTVDAVTSASNTPATV